MTKCVGSYEVMSMSNGGLHRLQIMLEGYCVCREKEALKPYIIGRVEAIYIYIYILQGR